MKTSSSIAGIAIAALLFTSSAASAQFCVFGVMIAAAYATINEGRELTSREAMSCGLLYGTEAQTQKPKKKKKVARRAKPN